ncbi:hypothetical protein AAU57_08920 [Nonlabens sp. YIK11]|uniref:hypothetical protein n=1 Tax=Nonlabens sp. YIK11 TaxID=1453349 RepID=UPI0006DBEE49|nr:hypothetical protein [Nonlabens sp. YIK11]KQC33425.1 hypothetical protein AAU57_08920 [Nonlabens sp. YIK11]
MSKEQKVATVKKEYTFYDFKENLELLYKEYKLLLLFFLPALGAIFQVYNLWMIDFSLVRFFSASQLINDGIALSIIVIAFLIYAIILEGITFEVCTYVVENPSRTRFDKYLRITFTIVLFILIFAIFIYNFYLLGYQSKPIVNYDLFYCLTLIILCCPLLFAIEDSIKGNTKKDFSFRAKWVFLGLIVINIFTRLPSYLEVDETENYQLVIDYVQEKYEVDVEKSDILYFNDQHIFVQKIIKYNENRKGRLTIFNPSYLERKIYIVPFSELF